MRFSDDFLEELRSRNDIESVVAPYCALKPRGRVSSGLCPFHNERTPSFFIYHDTQSYYCFGCGAGGDCITFIKTAENLDYTEAVKYLAERSGMHLPIDGGDDSTGKIRQRIYEANRLAAKFYYSTLISKEGSIAQEYLNTRGLTPETCRKFGIGFAPDTWDSLLKYLKQAGFSEDELISASLARRTKNGGCIDLFRNRLMFPVIDLRGNVIAFSGRIFDNSTPKYINSQETLVYKKSNVLYALNYAKKDNGGQLILCEGNMDVIALHQAGFTNAVAAMGTSFTANHAKLISTYANEVLLAFDGDEAGQKAVNKVMQILGNSPVKTRVIKLSGGKDPDEIIRVHGKERMRDILNGAVNDTEFRLSAAAGGLDLSTPDGKASYFSKAIFVLASIPNAVERDIYITKISSELEISKDAIKTEVAKELKKRQYTYRREEFTTAQKGIQGHPKITGPDKSHSAKTKRAEETLIRSLIKNPGFLKKIEELITPDDFFSETYRRLFFVTAEIIKADREIELIYYNNQVNDEEMGIITRLLNDTGLISNTLNECLDCINTLKEEKRKQESINPAQLSDSEFLNIIKNKSNT